MDVVATLLLLAAAPRPEVSLRDLDRFPDLGECQRMYGFANAHRGWLERQVCYFPPWRYDELSSWKDEADYAWRAWDYLTWSRRPDSMPYQQRAWLKCLKEMLPPEDWRDGRMPPPAPVWRFNETTRVK